MAAGSAPAQASRGSPHRAGTRHSLCASAPPPTNQGPPIPAQWGLCGSSGLGCPAHRARTAAGLSFLPALCAHSPCATHTLPATQPPGQRGTRAPLRPGLSLRRHAQPACLPRHARDRAPRTLRPQTVSFLCTETRLTSQLLASALPRRRTASRRLHVSHWRHSSGSRQWAWRVRTTALQGVSDGAQARGDLPF